MNKSYFSLPYTLENIEFGDEANVRFPTAFAEKLIQEFTKEGDIVLDPFAGFGTTLIAAEKLERVGYGVEYEKNRCQYIEKNISSPSRIIHGSALDLDTYNIPFCDFSLTSPPYMRNFDTENPFSNYHEEGSYKAYLKDIGSIYKKLKSIMKPGATIVLEVSNTFGKNKPMTPLAWDIAKELSSFLFFERELIFLHSEGEIMNPQHSYCLIFKNK